MVTDTKILDAGATFTYNYHRTGQHLDSNSDGDLFALVEGTGGNADLDIYVSTDGGSTWTKKYDVTTVSNGPAASLFVASDDKIFTLWQDTGLDIRVEMYSWDGSTLTQLGAHEIFYADTRIEGAMVAHPLNTDWFVHFVEHDYTTGFYLYTVKFNSTYGSTTHASSLLKSDTGAQSVAVDVALEHNGDGKTLSGDPDLWVGFRHTTSTVHYFYKYTYSASPDTWTKGTERSFSPLNGNAGGSLSVLCRSVYTGSAWCSVFPYWANSTVDKVEIEFRDSADTTYTKGTDSPSLTSADFEDVTEIAYHDGSIYVCMYNNTDSQYYWNVYDISGDSWGSWTAITVTGSPYPRSLKAKQYGTRGSSGNYFEALRFDATGDDMYHLVITAINSPPTATITSPTTGTNQDIEADLLIEWTYNDADSDAQTKYTIRRVADALTTEYWNGTGWVSSESGSTEISSSNAYINFGTYWGDPSTTTSYEYSVKVHDGTEFGAWSTGVTIFPTTTVSTNRGFSLPRPYKKQENLNAVLKSNTDYMLGWVNSYVPSYGDLNDDLYVKAGVRMGGESQFRDAFPPVVGEFDIGNGTEYFNAMGATNIYRTNEIALSEKKTKDIFGDMLMISRELFREPKVKAFKYKEEKRNAGKAMRFGLVAEDLMRSLADMGINPYESSLIHTDDDGRLYIVENQLIYLLWHAVQELQAEVAQLDKDIKNK